MTTDKTPTGPHLVDGEFQSDKYPTCPRGKVPLSTKDPTAQDLLWTYAQRRRSVDADFAADLEAALRAHGYEPTKTPTAPTADERARLRRVAMATRNRSRLPWLSDAVIGVLDALEIAEGTVDNVLANGSEIARELSDADARIAGLEAELAAAKADRPAIYRDGAVASIEAMGKVLDETRADLAAANADCKRHIRDMDRERELCLKATADLARVTAESRRAAEDRDAHARSLIERDARIRIVTEERDTRERERDAALQDAASARAELVRTEEAETALLLNIADAIEFGDREGGYGSAQPIVDLALGIKDQRDAYHAALGRLVTAMEGSAQPGGSLDAWHAARKVLGL